MSEKRANIILSYIRKNREVSLRELCSLFPDYNEMTIRRDLNLLARNGYITRTHGGAKLIEDSLQESHLFKSRAAFRTAEKKRIAVKALPHITGAAVYLDASTTVREVASLLPDTPRLIITNSTVIANELRHMTSVEVLLTGGFLNRDLFSVSGPDAVRTLSGINIDTAVMGASGVSAANGFTNRVFSECELKKQAVTNAEKVVMLADSSKFGITYPYTFAGWNDIDILITEKGLTPAMEDEARINNIKIV